MLQNIKNQRNVTLGRFKREYPKLTRNTRGDSDAQIQIEKAIETWNQICKLNNSKLRSLTINSQKPRYSYGKESNSLRVIQREAVAKRDISSENKVNNKGFEPLQSCTFIL